MATTSELDRVSMVMLRYMRGPIFALIVVYAIGIIVMALIPGQDADGNPEYMSLFHAFYFFTYTATTTGFGEIPTEFTDAQRLWAIVCIYMGVIAWLYAIGSIFRLVQNPHFLLALNEHRFAGSVRRIREPFFIICGFGDTGSLLARGLSDNWLRGVIMDTDPERIKALKLRDYHVDMPGLCADPAVPKHLVDAGVHMPNCKALVILTVNEEVNARIATMTRLLNPELHLLCRSSSRHHIEQLQSLGKVTIINPFEIFAQLLSMAITAPRLHNLNACLVHSPGVRLGQPIKVPTGDWIICGYGRMGRWMYRHFVQNGISPVIIDPNVRKVEGAARIINEHANPDTLLAAGIDHAAGVVAGTDSDHVNLSILMSVHRLKPDAFTIVRQNSHENQIAFDATNANLVLQSSLTTARRVLKHLISPQVQIFIEYLREQGEDICEQTVDRLKTLIGDCQPQLWRVCLRQSEAEAVIEHLQQGLALSLGELRRDPHDLENTLPCMPLSIARGEQRIMLPADSELLQAGDELLFCGTEGGERMLSSTMNNPYTLDYLITGEDKPRGYVFKWLAERKQASAPSS
ncbi:MAG: potassium channel protein [Gammaproteobacteria bacterium]|nr:MAG: potassium transporter [Gammaproteobacteria bacterium]UCH39606.1 MAG: potassium channel protein [Gammaproteobacteria bacterium]